MSVRYPVVNASITASKREFALDAVLERAESGSGGYACFVNAHVCVMTKQQSEVKAAIKEATFAYPDGAPVYFVGRYLHGRQIDKISGPDFIDMVFSSDRGRKLRHFFYGGSPEVLDQLIKGFQERYPGCNIVGGISPPYRELTQAEKDSDLETIRDSGAQMVWVGLGAPKQEIWMNQNSAALPGAMLMGVGAAFDFHAGFVKRAPRWMQRFGLEWLHRLSQEPGRLWKRYLTTNCLFIFLQALTLARHTVPLRKTPKRPEATPARSQDTAELAITGEVSSL